MAWGTTPDTSSSTWTSNLEVTDPLPVIESVTVRRVYDPKQPTDATSEVLVDRLWPRGVSRSQIPEGSWAREVAPSTELRGWYQHDPARFAEFTKRYRAELDGNPEVDRLLAMKGHLTLLTAVRDVEISHAVALRDYLLERLDI